MQPEKQPSFRAVLRPNRSLSNRGFVILMSVVGLISFVAGVAFMMIGAWPIFGFFGLDVALIYWAFRCNFRDSEWREIVEVTPHEIVVSQVSPRHEVKEMRFTRPWVSVDLVRDDERELVGALTLSQSGRRFEIAQCLGPDEKAGFYQALREALA